MHGLLDVLDSRSFSSLWYWLLLTVTWTWVGRGALGIPSELVRAVHRRAAEGADETPAAASPDSLLLLDWVSLVTPRWQVSDRDGAVLTAVAAFVVSALAWLGFAYGRELAQAMVLLVAPLLVLVVLRIRLATRLRATLAEAEAGRITPDLAAADMARRITRHMRLTMALSMLAVGGAALWGTAWLATHPLGI